MREHAYPPESGGSIVRDVLSANYRGGSLARIAGMLACIRAAKEPPRLFADKTSRTNDPPNLGG